MAKLAIYRGETLEREVELAPRNARIGRGDQNDIVLPDAAKSVSRFHAELRFENGRYTIVDLNSQNGTWVAGKRVPQALLEAGVPVILGTYRLVFIPGPAPEVETMVSAAGVEAPHAPTAAPAEPVGGPLADLLAAPPAAPQPPLVPPPAPEPVAPPPSLAAPVAAAPLHPPAEPPVVPTMVRTEPPKPTGPPAPPAAAPVPPRAATAPPVPPAATKPAASSPVPPPKPTAAKPATPPPAASKAATATKAKTPKPPGKGMSKGLLFGGLAVLVLAAAAAGLFLWPVANPAPPAGSAQAQNAAPPAATSAAQPEGAPATPGGAPTAEAGAPAGAPPAAGAPGAGTPEAASPSAVPPAPTPAEAAAASPATSTPQADAKLPAAQRTARPASAAGAVRDRKSGTAARRGGPEPKGRVVNVQQTFEQARSAMSKGEYLAAIAGFEAVLKADPNYPEASQLLGVARGGARNAAQLAVETGNKAETSGDYAGAARQYERAQQLDPESSAPADALKRMRARMQGEGEDAFRRAKQFDALGRTSDAIAMYEKALQLLPADHPSAKTAKERLAALRGGH